MFYLLLKRYIFVTLTSCRFLIRTPLLLILCTLPAAAPASAHARYPDSFYTTLSESSVSDIFRMGQRCESPDSAMAYFTIAIMRYEAHPDKKMQKVYTQVLNHAGYTSLFALDNFNDAYYYMLKARQSAEETGDSAQMAVIALNLANVFVGASDLETAFGYYRRSMRLARKAKDWDSYLSAFIGYVFQAMASDNLGSLHKELDTFPADSVKNAQMGRYALLLRDGLNHMLRKEYSEAADSFGKSLNYINTPFTPERYPIVSIFLKQKAIVATGDTAGAIEYIKSSLPAITDESKVSVYNVLSKLYRGQGDTVQADHYRLLYLEGVEQLGLSTRSTDIARARHFIDRRLLQQDLDRLHKERQMHRMIAMICGAWALVVTILIIMLWRSKRRLARSKENLFSKNREIAGLSIKEATVPAAASSGDSSAAEAQHEPEEDKPDEEMKEMWRKVSEAMQLTDEKFLNDFSVARLAVIVGEHPKKVSKAVNLHTGKNFSAWLTEIRVNEACLRLSDMDTYGKYTISAISESLGFRSRTHFSEVFKLQTGLSPSEYMKIARSKLAKRNS